MLDKVTKAYYNFLALFCFCSFYMLLLLKIKILKGFYQATLKGAVQSSFLKQTLLSPIFRSIPFSIAIKLKY
ncbi:hypothetical protein [Helicobacter pylori]|uniref:hypothetical protein n=1 Tax=Helicobacter pylori TaxID=210 RepID=UPI0013E3FF5D|nr:hypothetical protein [Helicobacter pylori]